MPSLRWGSGSRISVSVSRALWEAVRPASEVTVKNGEQSTSRAAHRQRAHTRIPRHVTRNSTARGAGRFGGAKLLFVAHAIRPVIHENVDAVEVLRRNGLTQVFTRFEEIRAPRKMRQNDRFCFPDFQEAREIFDV